MIFKYVVPTGVISLSRVNYHTLPRYKIYSLGHDRSDIVSLSFLRTCKKIYDECKDLLWETNTLDVEVFRCQVFGGGVSSIDEKIASRVKAIQMNLDFTDWTRIHDDSGLGQLSLGHDLSALEGWGKLQKLTLIARSVRSDDPTILGYDGLDQIFALRNNGRPSQDIDATDGDTVYHEILGILNTAGGTVGYLSHLERGIAVELGPSVRLDLERGRFPQVRVFSENPDSILTAIGSSFGGRLTVSGQVYRDDGQTIPDIFVRASGHDEGYVFEKSTVVTGLAHVVVDSYPSRTNV